MIIIITYLYLLKSDGKYKIGVSNNPEDRVNQLQTGCPYNISLVTAEEFDSKKYAHKIEDRLHKELSDYREEGEWFDIANTTYVEVINEFGFEVAQNIFSEIKPNMPKSALYFEIVSLHNQQINNLHDLVSELREQVNSHQDNTKDDLLYMKLMLIITLIVGVIF